MTGDPLRLDDPRTRVASFEARAVLSPTGRVLDADANMIQLLGRDPATVLDASFARFVAPADRPTFRRALVRSEPGRRWRVRLQHDGHVHEALMTAARPSIEHDDVVIAVLAGDDAAHLRARADELARSNATKQAVIDSLQAALVPEPRPVAGLAVAVRHAAHHAVTAVSGDASDVLPLDRDRCHVALVDVTGHGVAHAAEALLLVQTLRVLALGGTPVGQLFAAALPLVRAQERRLSAAGVVGRFDARTGQLELAGAGAPPVAVLRADGATELVGLPGAPFGFDVGPSTCPVDVQLDVGDQALLVTDGVLGRRPDRWETAVREISPEATRGPLDRLAAALVQSAVDDGASDDATVVALRRVVRAAPLPRPDELVFELVLDHALVDVPPARLALRRWLGQHPVPLPVVDDAVLVMSELASNAVRVARTTVTVTAQLEDDGRVRIDVRDDGPGLPPAAQARLLDARGAADRTRGLFLVAEIADDVFVASDGSGTLVRTWCRGEPTPEQHP